MLNNWKTKSVMGVVLIATAAGFGAMQMEVKWGGQCAYGLRVHRSTQTFGFPAPAVNLHSTVDRYEPDPFQRNTLHVSVEPSGFILNVLTLGAVLVFVSLGLRRVFACFGRSPVGEPLGLQRTGILRHSLLRRGALFSGVKKS